MLDGACGWLPSIFARAASHGSKREQEQKENVEPNQDKHKHVHEAHTCTQTLRGNRTSTTNHSSNNRSKTKNKQNIIKTKTEGKKKRCGTPAKQTYTDAFQFSSCLSSYVDTTPPPHHHHHQHHHHKKKNGCRLFACLVFLRVHLLIIIAAWANQGERRDWQDRERCTLFLFLPACLCVWFCCCFWGGGGTKTTHARTGTGADMNRSTTGSKWNERVIFCQSPKYGGGSGGGGNMSSTSSPPATYGGGNAYGGKLGEAPTCERRDERGAGRYSGAGLSAST